MYDAETGLNYNYFRDYDSAVGRFVESDPIGLHGGSYSTYGYVASNPIALVDPLGLEPPKNMGQGYTGRVDSFNYGGESSYEIHIFDPEGNEVGVYGPKGWIAKHGFSGRPAGLPNEVENACKTFAQDRLKGLKVPVKGRLRIKGGRWMRFLMWLPLIDWYAQETQPSIDQACQLNPNFEGC